MVVFRSIFLDLTHEGCTYMATERNKNHKRRWSRLFEITRYTSINLFQYLQSCNLLCFTLSVMLFLLIGLLFCVGCLDCFRQLGCNWLCSLNIRSLPMGNFVANATNWLAGWLASIFCIPKEGGLLIHIYADQLNLSAEASSLSLAPAQIVLSTIGTGGVTLCAISEFRVRRYWGISMRDVLHHYYPGHICFVVMHVLLYIFGIYVIERNMVRCSMLALLGILLCSIYTVVFSFGAFSSEKLTKSYIGALANRNRVGSNGAHVSLLGKIAFHIGKEYSENSREMIGWFNSYCLTFVRLLQVALKDKHSSKQNTSLFSHAPWDETEIFKDAFCISQECCTEGDPTDWVFYRLLMDREKQQTYTDYFGTKVKTLQLVWKNLFRPFEEDIEGQAEAAAAILTAAYIHSYPNFITIVCSLSLYLHDIDPSKSTDYNPSNFLRKVLKYSQYLQRELCKEANWITQKSSIPYQFKCSQEDWRTYRKALGLIELSVTLWEISLHSRNTGDLSATYNELLEIADFTNYDDLETSRRELRLYMAYGYSTYLTALSVPSLYPSRDLVPLLLCYFEEAFYKKIVTIN